MLCPHCSRVLDDALDLAGQVVACPHCGGQFVIPGSAPTVVNPSAYRRRRSRGGFGPALFSLLLPGLGQLLDGRAERGLLLLLVWVVCIVASFFVWPLFFVAGVLWLWSVVDAASG